MLGTKGLLLKLVVVVDVVSGGWTHVSMLAVRFIRRFQTSRYGTIQFIHCIFIFISN